MTPWLIAVLVLIGLIFLYLALCLVFLALANRKMFGHHVTDPANPCYLRYEDYASWLARSPYQAPYYGKWIRGYVYQDRNRKEPFKGFVILSHGMFGTHVQYLLDIAMLAKDGYKVLAYDHYGCGESGGEAPEYLAHGVYVLENVLRDVEERNLAQGLPLFLYGHSWGAYSVSGALKNHPEVKKAVIRSAPVSPRIAGKDVLRHFAPHLYRFLFLGYDVAYTLLIPHRFRISALRGERKNHETRILMLQAKNDPMVPYAHSLARRFERKGPKNVEVFVTEKGLHNTLLQESGMANYQRLVKRYKEIQQEPSKAERDHDEAVFEKQELGNRVSLYPYDEKTRQKILSFLDGE